MYPGGKDGAGVFQRLVNEVPPHDVWVSAFLGDCALLRRKRPAAVNVGIDLDSTAVARFAGSEVANGRPGVQLYRCDGIEWLRFAFDLDRVGGPGDRAAVVARFGVPAGRVFVYVDPPYLRETRKNGKRLYRCEMSEADHCRLLAVVRVLPCLVMVSHYACPMYDSALGAWRSFEFRAWTRGGWATEKVWCNYPKPERLHDARWLGGTKREREKFARRRRNLREKLLRLSAVERQSILDGLG